ncbi:RICIN domain-containing protein [Kitasatospora sp. MBT66]|uniref:RICIN domain-containing protein n=1 Tax=Kitasatospora sp. MBT66 TaxID=1444769 RepID=UPI00351556F3
MAFSATANGSTVALGPFHDAQGFNCSVYWNTRRTSGFRLLNAGSGLVLGVQNMSTADGRPALQWNDSGTADHDWELVVDGTALRLRNVNSGRVLGVRDMSTADDAPVLQWNDSGTADHRWTVVGAADGSHGLRNANSGRMLGIAGASTSQGAEAVLWDDNGTSDHLWRFL